jgi:hypothetical protein
MSEDDPRDTGEMPNSGPVTLFHASEAPVAVILGEGLNADETGTIWVASSKEIADLQRALGRKVLSMVTVTVMAELLDYSRTNGDVHQFAGFATDPLTIDHVEECPE